MARRDPRDGRPGPREADRGGRRVRRRADRAVPRRGHAPRGATSPQGAKDGFANARLAPVLRRLRVEGDRDRPAARLHRRGVPLPARSRAVDGDRQGRRGEGARVRPERAARPRSCSRRVSDPFVGHITMFRVFSGKVRPDSLGAQRDAGHRRADRPAVRAAGARTTRTSPRCRRAISAPSRSCPHTHTGDTFATKDDPVQLPAVELPEPLLAYAIAPKTKGEEDKLATGLARLREEDPTFRVARNDETHETVIYGMGEAHLGVQMERLKAKFGVEVEAKPAKIAVPGDDPRQGEGAGAPREAERRPRPVRGVRDRDRAAPAGRGLRLRGQDLRRRDPAAVHPLDREGHREDDVRGRPVAATRWSTSRSRSSTGSSTPWTPPTWRSRSRARSR